jgi:P-type E1-E2 ATPase
MELASEHLLGRSVIQYSREKNVRPSFVEQVDIRKGEGITAISSGERYFAGNLKLVEAMGAPINADKQAEIEMWQKAGKTVAYFGRENVLLGAMAFGDRVKSGATEMIEELRRRSVATILVSGDATATTAAVASQIGVDSFVGEVSPEGKAALVRRLQQEGKRVAMIGDGVNDAPALAIADLGIALGTGAEIAMSAAPVVLVSGSLEKLEETFQIASRTTRVIRQNLFWAFFYNTAGIVLALGGFLSPIMAAGAMLLSSTSVIANSMRLSQARKATKNQLHASEMDLKNQLQYGSHRG